MAQARSSRLPSLVIVGVGRLGGALARGYQRARGRVWVLPRSSASVRRAVELGLRLADEESLAAADLCFLCVPDPGIRAAALDVAPALKRGAALVHCAGALTLDALGSAKTLGSRPRASFHPLCAVSAPTDSLAGHSVALSASTPQTLRRLRAVAKALDLSPLQVPEPGRTAYHAGAVLAAGGLVALASAATAALEAAGIEHDEALQALLPLMRSAIAGMERRGLQAGLTGPVARGDAKTVTRHLRALPAALRPLYRELMRRSVELLGTQLPRERRAALRRAL